MFVLKILKLKCQTEINSLKASTKRHGQIGKNFNKKFFVLKQLIQTEKTLKLKKTQ